MTRLAFLTLGLTLALSSACGGDDGNDCPQGECVVRHPPTEPDTDEPERCAAACANLLGECAAASAKGDDVGQCQDDCRVVFTPKETSCLAALTCGESADACFE
jgi:hypothetical protein